MFSDVVYDNFLSFSNKAHPEVLKDYQKRVELLKGVISAEKLVSC